MDSKKIEARSRTSRPVSYLDTHSEEASASGLYRMLNETGRLNQIKASLRREIFSHLLENNKTANAVDIDLLTSTPGRLSLALTAGFLRQHFSSTFSVFMAEANLAWLPVDDDESLIMSRLGIPLEMKSENKVHVSALEHTVQHLLKQKLNEASNKRPVTENDKTKLQAAWLPAAMKGSELATEQKPVGESKSAEVMLSEMRALIREELGALPAVAKVQAPTQRISDNYAPKTSTSSFYQLQQQEFDQSSLASANVQKLSSNNNKNMPPVGTSPAPVLDESRLHEYLEKMIERMLGARHTVSSNVKETEKSDEAKTSVDAKEAHSEKAAAKRPTSRSKAPSQMSEKKSTTKSPVKASPSKRLSFVDDVASKKSPAKHQLPRVGKSREQLSSVIALEEIKRKLASSDGILPSDIRPSSVPVLNDSVTGVEEARLRLATLEKEAASLESTYHQRLASLDSAQPATSTVNLISRLTTSGRRHLASSNTVPPFTVTSLLNPHRSPSGSAGTTTTNSLPHSAMIPTTYDMPRKSYSRTSGGSLISELISSQRQSPLRSACSKLPASSRILSAVKPIPVVGSSFYDELSLEDELLTSVPPVDHRSVKARQDVSRPAPQLIQMPFSVFPNGIQNEMQEIIQQQQQPQQQQHRFKFEPKPSPNLNESASSASKAALPKQSSLRLDRDHSTEPVTPNVAVQHSSPSKHVDFDDEALSKITRTPVTHQYSTASTPEDNQPSTAAGKSHFYSPTILQQQQLPEQVVEISPLKKMDQWKPVEEQTPRYVPEIRSHHEVIVEPTPTRKTVSPPLPAYSREADSNFELDTQFVESRSPDYAQPLVSNKIEPSPSTKPIHEEALSVPTTTSTQPDEPEISQPDAGGDEKAKEDDDVDDVLKKYMQMVLEQRASAKEESPKKSPAAGRNYNDDDDDEEEAQPTYGLNRNRFSQPRISSGAKGRSDDDPPSANDDFWS